MRLYCLGFGMKFEKEKVPRYTMPNETEVLYENDQYCIVGKFFLSENEEFPAAYLFRAAESLKKEFVSSLKLSYVEIHSKSYNKTNMCSQSHPSPR